MGKVARQKAKRQKIQEVRVLELGTLKEVPKAKKDVTEEIIGQNFVLDELREGKQMRLLCGKRSESILLPEVLKVIFNPMQKMPWKGFAVREAAELEKPVVKVQSLIYDSHFFIKIGDDIDEAAEHDREEPCSNQHQE